VVQTFQQNVAPGEDYAGAVDTYLSSYWPDWNFQSEDDLRVGQRPSGSERVLVRFALQDHIPTGARVIAAKLALFAWSKRTTYATWVSAFKVSRPWGAAATSWNRADTLQFWGSPGCSEVNADYQGNPLDSRSVYFINQYYEWDVAAAVQHWVTDPNNNQGLLVASYDGDQDVRFRSSQWRVLLQRPKLTVEYWLP
jgi:hypothetical protein